jgi:hypothetical protein
METAESMALEAATKFEFKGVERLVADLSDTLQGPTAKTSRTLNSLLDTCGYKSKSDRRLALMQSALGDAGIYSLPPLTSPGRTPGEIIRLSRVPYSTVQLDLFFPSEDYLEQFLLHNFANIQGLKGLRSPKRQFTLPSGDRIDLLFRERRTGNYVVVELKAGSGGRGVLAQLQSYMDELEPIAAKDAKTVRGVIITSHPNPLLEKQVRLVRERAGVQVDLYCYIASLRLAPLVGPAAQATELPAQSVTLVATAQPSDPSAGSSKPRPSGSDAWDLLVCQTCEHTWRSPDRDTGWNPDPEDDGWDPCPRCHSWAVVREECG